MLFAAITLAGLGKVLTFLVMLSILVVLHEFGHFLLARRNGVRINEFSVGMGPRLLGWRSPRTGTEYSLRLLPIGGYCAMLGEDGKTNEAEQQREFREQRASEPQQLDSANFQAKSPWRRLAIIVAGPVANFVLAYIILLFGALAFGVQSDTQNQAVVYTVEQGTPASENDVRAGDAIVEIEGKPVTSGAALIAKIHGSLGKPLDLVFVRNGQRRLLTLTPKPCPREENVHWGCIGFVPFPAYVRVSVPQAFVASANEYAAVVAGTFGSIALLVTHFSTYASQVSGPIGIGQAATTIQDFGWGPYCWLAATISFALGLFNLLPIPALDGGRAAFVVAELIRGKPVDPEREGMVHVAGFAVLMLLMLVVAFHDISRIVSGQGVF